jgi:hypothetical protein
VKARNLLAFVVLVAACLMPMAPDAPRDGIAPDSLEFGSGVADMLVSCTGPACPDAPFPRAAAVVKKHEYYAAPFAGTTYIAPVADGTTITPPGYVCCTTAVFERDFVLPAGVDVASLTIELLADNQATVAINGIPFGAQPRTEMSNFMGPAHTFTTTFVPDAGRANRLTITFVDEGGALGLNYLARVSVGTHR